MADNEMTKRFADASFTGADFTGATFRDCDFSGVKIVDTEFGDISVAGWFESFRVNDVDVTQFVRDELDRRHPERVQLRAVRTADDHRAMWETIERIWAEAVARAERLPEPLRQERVDDEWSFTETLRHLMFASDAWIGSSVLDEEVPYHRLGLSYSGYEQASEIGLDIDARPSFAEVLEARTGRLAVVRRFVDGLTDEDLERMCTRAPAPGYPEKPKSVRKCLRVAMDEEVDHLRYAVRDLAVLEAR